jgi:hypothetical protein
MTAGENKGCSYVLLVSFEAPCAPPLAFALRNLPACLVGGQLSGDPFKQGMNLLDGVHLGSWIVWFVVYGLWLVVKEVPRGRVSGENVELGYRLVSRGRLATYILRWLPLRLVTSL